MIPSLISSFYQWRPYRTRTGSFRHGQWQTPPAGGAAGVIVGDTAGSIGQLQMAAGGGITTRTVLAFATTRVPAGLTEGLTGGVT